MAQLSSGDVHNVTFAKAPPGRRGYDEEQVDAFLDRVEATIAELTRQIAALRDRPPADTTVPGVSGAAEAAVLAELDQIRTRLARIEAAVVPAPAPVDALR